MCFCWTNLPTTWMQSLSTGWNNIYNNMKVRLLLWRTTVTSSITLPDGFLNWIVVKVSPGKVTTLPGWNKRPNVWKWKKRPPANVVKHWNVSWNGYAWLRKPVRRKVRHVLTLMTNCWMRTWRRKKRNLKSLFRMVPVWVIRSLKPNMWLKHTVINCCLTIWTLCFLLMVLSVWLALMVRERRHCSAWLWDWKQWIKENLK